MNKKLVVSHTSLQERVLKPVKSFDQPSPNIPLASQVSVTSAKDLLDEDFDLTDDDWERIAREAEASTSLNKPDVTEEKKFPETNLNPFGDRRDDSGNQNLNTLNTQP